jgi:hypothetical protein
MKVNESFLNIVMIGFMITFFWVILNIGLDLECKRVELEIKDFKSIQKVEQ